MMIAARASFTMPQGEPPTAQDYVRTGLIAMWDGIENAGWGTHAASPSAWTDLVGTAHWQLGSAFAVGDDYVEILAGVSYNGQGHCTQTWVTDDVKAIEAVLDFSNYTFVAPGWNPPQVAALGIGDGNGRLPIRVWAGSTDNVITLAAPGAVSSCSSGTDAYSYNVGASTVCHNGVVATGAISSGYYVYSGPLLGSYPDSWPAAIGVRIKALRIYSRQLSEAEQTANWRVDRARFFT